MVQIQHQSFLFISKGQLIFHLHIRSLEIETQKKKLSKKLQRLHRDSFLTVLVSNIKTTYLRVTKSLTILEETYSQLKKLIEEVFQTNSHLTICFKIQENIFVIFNTLKLQKTNSKSKQSKQIHQWTQTVINPDQFKLTQKKL